MINRNGANVSPCRTPVVTGKVSESPSGVETKDVEPSYRLLIALTILVGIPYRERIVNIYSRDMESNALEKSTKVAHNDLSFFVEISSTILRTAKISSTVDLEGLKPF